MTHAGSTQAIKRLSKQKPVLHDWAVMTQQTCLIGHLLVELLKKGLIFLIIRGQIGTRWWRSFVSNQSKLIV